MGISGPLGPEPSRARWRRPGRYATLAAAVLATAFLACYPGGITDSRSSSTVTTLFDDQAEFAAIGTYAVPDSVIHLLVEGEPDTLSRANDAVVLNAIRRNMNALGYREVADPEVTRPDVAMLASVSTSVYLGYYYDFYGYWGWYGGWPGYAPGWSWYYPYVAVPYAYETGTVLVSMVDLRNPDPALQRVPVMWIAGLNGVLSGGSEAARVDAGIDQAFQQSPYLGTSAATPSP